MAPALKFSATTSKCGTRARNSSRPRSLFRSRPRLRLLRLLRRNVAPTRRPCGSSIAGNAPRPDSPSTGCSTFTTSAPSRASSCVPNGSACICSAARTRTPSSGLPYFAASGLPTSPSFIAAHRTARVPCAFAPCPTARRGGTLRGAHRLRGALRHLVGRHVLDVRRDGPTVTERILELARPVAIELVLDGAKLLRAGLERAGEHVVHGFHVDPDGHGCPAERLRPLEAHVRVLVCENDAGATELELCVSHLPTRAGHAHALGRAEHALVELDRVARTVDHEV